MADDLSQFFAKKTQKSKEKKKGVIKLDAVGQQLERKVKRQEERDREDEEDERHHQAEEQFLKSRKDPEDSEWLDYNDPNKEIKLAEFGIKDMNFTEQVELYDEEEERATPSEPTKTWNVPTAQDENQAPVDLPPPPTDGSQKYVPAHMRATRLRPTVTPDINNQELFPSLAAADQIEKHQRDSEKREEQRRMEFNEKQSKMAEDRQAALNLVKQVNPNTYQVPGRRPEQPSEAPSSSPPPAAANNPNAYVPPHLRKGAGGGDGPSEPPPSGRAGGSPWSGRDHSGPAPPPPSTNNRFASLKE